ncbi:heterokaryon incompatibility protein [Diplodia corticola]|uniref:Heterokaryon incompatibility protein n=1 Tax=Diplodia corticola TaxID=236234 RepID=A0A1J9QNJ5_9PEZI|nr:heterokaryon incompatibility protein [Diplodia corticola]OJD29634.1 heterokaryon incompatibility protein [Diplodia corticola]
MDPPAAQLCAACTKVIQQISVHDPNGLGDRHLSDLAASASSCSLCYLTKKAFEDAGYEKDLEPRDDEEGRRLLEARYLQFWVRPADVKDAVDYTDDDMPGICSPAATSGKVYSGPNITSSGSPSSFAHINNLISGCIAQHPECALTLDGTLIDESQPPALPTRILDLGDPSLSSPSIRLLETQPGQRGHYAALSYCWGPPSSHPPTTTSANLAAHTAGIAVASLPATFQDAVQATRELGLRHLWIDSLCIVQDNESDWRREAARMGPVYSRARVVLAASDAATPSSGIFRQYPARPAVTLPFLDAATGAAAGVVRAELRPPAAVLSPDSEHAPLNARAWATQEYVLARRIVYFTRGAAVWSCRRCRKRALWDDGVLDYAYGRTKTDWARLVTEFSTRQCAVLTDRLVALGGVVEELARLRGSGKQELPECVYGLWTDALATHLMWSRLGRPGELSRPPELKGVAPTWSWASTLGGVGLMSEERYSDDGPEVRAQLAVESGGEDEGKKRRIRIKGKLGRVELRIIEKPSPYLHPCDCEVRGEEGGDIVGLAASDVGLGEGMDSASVFCLVVMFHPHNFENGSYLVLYLRPREEKSDEYVRIGNGMIMNKEWVEGLTESELYLV